jgi:hypothetical protein
MTNAAKAGLWVLLLPFVALAISGCSPVKQPESIKFVAAVALPLERPSDRSDLIAILRRDASAGGLHVEDVSDAWARLGARERDPLLRKSIYIGLWRGFLHGDLEVTVDDGGHPGRPWVIFSRGEHPTLAGQFRDGLLRDINHRWPDALELPISPSGGLPLVQDLRATPTGYKIVRSAAAGYGLPLNSPLVSPE